MRSFLQTTRRMFFPVFLILLALGLQSHEFWMQPAGSFQLRKGDSVAVSLRVGESFEGEPWRYKADRIVGWHLYEGSKKSDVRSLVHPDTGSLAALRLTFDKAGTKMIALETNSTFIELEADKFTAYLKEDGLWQVLKQREETQTTDKPGRELYARNAKILLSVEGKTDDTHSINTGMPLEIVPLRNPYSLRKRSNMTFRITYQDKALANALVKVWHKNDKESNMKEYTTNHMGEIIAPISPMGSWMVSVVHMAPSAHPEKADWQSYWASLTFGYTQ